MRRIAIRSLRALTLGMGLAVAALTGCLTLPGSDSAFAAPKAVAAKSAPLQLVRRKTVTRKRFKSQPKHRRVSRRRHERRDAPHERRGRAEARPKSPPPQAKAASVQNAEKDDRAGVIMIAAGEVEGTDARIASDIAAEVDRPDMRVLPVLSRNSLEVLRELSSSPVIDVALAHSDALDQAKADDPALATQIGYIARLFDEEVYVLAGPGLTNIHQLDGKKVAIGVAGSGDAVTAGNLFGRLGIHPQLANEDTQPALAALGAGKIDAVVIVAGKPAPALLAASAPGVHMLSVPYDASLQEQYYPATLTHTDYPNLIPPGGRIDTIAVGTLLVAPMGPADTPRSDRIAAFAHAFLSNFNALLAPGRHPKWKDVNLAADAPGWTRIPAAREWLDSAEAEQEQFSAFVAAQPNTKQNLSDADHDRLFEEFVQWKRKQAH
jgi:TRAP-type uncharacterized transport system substrate-binding protein